MTGIDLKDRSHECPKCGWRLAAGAFCMHYDEETGAIAEVLDAVPAKISAREWQEAREARAELRGAVSAEPVAPEPTKRGAPRERPGSQLRLSDGNGRRI